jgi:broad specificity phosphatase PhoE
MPERDFLCLRHGMTDWNAKGLFQGRSDVPLNEQGLAQALTAAQSFKASPPDIIVSSPLIRAAHTAKLIASAADMPVHIEDDLIECDFGSFEGRPIREVMNEHNVVDKAALARILPSDAEKWETVSRRALNCIGRWQALHRAKSILFVCHDAVMQALAEQLCGHWFENRHAVPYLFSLNAASWAISEHKLAVMPHRP